MILESLSMENVVRGMDLQQCQALYLADYLSEHYSTPSCVLCYLFSVRSWVTLNPSRSWGPLLIMEPSPEKGRR